MSSDKQPYDPHGRNCKGASHELRPCPYIDECNLCIWYNEPDTVQNYCIGLGGNPLKCKRDNPNFKLMTKKQFMEIYKQMSGRTNNLSLMELYEQAKIDGMVEDD